MADYQYVVRSALPIKVRQSTGLLILCFFLVRCTSAVELTTYEIPLQGEALQTTLQGLYDAPRYSARGRTPHVPVLIVPHHLTAAVTIATGISVLQEQRPSSIVLLSPDHFGACKNFFCTSSMRFKSSFGVSESDLHVLASLQESPLVSKESNLFPREHGITTVFPFITELLPEAKVTPLVIAIRPDWKAHQEELLGVIRQALDQHAVLVISSDFSHYLNLAEADRADERTAKTLFARDFAGIARLENPAQSDCPACLWIGANVASERDAYNPSVLLRTNSARLLNEEQAPSTTSHFAIAFYESASLTPDDSTFAGDVTVTRAATGSILMPPKSVRAFWEGAGPRIVNLEGPLQERCFTRIHQFIFCNLLSTWKRVQPFATHWGIENNHKLDLGEEGYRQTSILLSDHHEVPVSDTGTEVGGMRIWSLTNLMNPVAAEEKADLRGQYDRVIHALRAGSSATLPHVVFVHTGTEYKALLTEQEQKYLRSFVDSGARAVFAMHSHVPSDMEMYKGVPIFRGLGNFIFDQTATTETATSKVVRLRFSEGSTLFQTMTGR